MKYEFHVGDYVETVDGRVGYITDICKCSMCKKRDWYEPTIKYSDTGETDFISSYGSECIPETYVRIGQYDFTKPDKEDGIKPLIKSWVLDDADSANEYYFDSREVIRKINELVDAVNELRKASVNVK